MTFQLHIWCRGDLCVGRWWGLLDWRTLSPPLWSPQTYYCCFAAAAKSLQSCLTLCDPIDGSPPGSPVPGILQARTLEWVAISFSNAWKWKVKVKSLSPVRLFAMTKASRRDKEHRQAGPDRVEAEGNRQCWGAQKEGFLCHVRHIQNAQRIRSPYRLSDLA